MAKSNLPYIRERPGHEQYETKTVRKIDNGYLVTETMDDSGGYRRSERFEEKYPEDMSSGGEKYGKMTLSDAISKLKG